MNELRNLISKNRPTLMGIAIIMIIFFHQYWLSFFPFNIFHTWGHYGVDVFLFVSGFGMTYSLSKHNMMEFYKRRFIRIVPLCLFCGLLKYVIYMSGGGYFSDIKTISIWTIFGLDLWFIQAILVLYLLTPFVYWCLRKSMILVFSFSYMLCVITYIFFPEVLNTFTGSINRFPVFLMGMMIALYSGFGNFGKLVFSFFMLFLAALGTLCVQKHLFHWANDLWMYPVLSFGIPSFIYFLSIILGKLPIVVRRVLDSIGKHSLELYLWHEFVFSCLWVTLNAFFSPLVMFIVALIISFACAYASSRIIGMILKITKV